MPETKVTGLTQAGDTATLKEHQGALYFLLCRFDAVCRELDIPYYLFAGTLLGAVRHGGFIPWDDDLDVLMMRADYDRLMREAPQLFAEQDLYLQRENSDHWPMFFSKLRINGTTCLEPYHPKDKQIHQGVYMDIFPCDNAYGTKAGRWLQFAASKVVIAKGLDAEGYVTDSRAKKLFMALCRLLPRDPFYRFVKGPKKQGSCVHSFLGASSRFARSVYPASCFRHSVPMAFESGTFRCPQAYDELLKILYGDYRILPEEEQLQSKKHTILVDLNRSYEHYEGYRDGMRFEHSTRSIR